VRAARGSASPPFALFHSHHELVDVHRRVHRDLAAKVVVELLVPAAGGGVVAQQLGEGLRSERGRGGARGEKRGGELKKRCSAEESGAFRARVGKRLACPACAQGSSAWNDACAP